MLPRLYVVCDADVCARAGWVVTDFAAACLDGGASLIQLRNKHAGSRVLLADAEAVVRRAGSLARVIVNDRADIARLAGAAGVHVGQDDMAPDDVRLVTGPDVMLGLSTHTAGQLQAAMRRPIDYVAIGPVFGTATKDTGYEAVGLALVREAAALTAPSGRPVVAIGGITIDSAPEVIAAGATSVAVITDLLVGGDPCARVRAFVDRLSRV
ncbi:MAG: thiamine phosphate synthase [Vicinamibacterales bacterium]